VAAFGLRAGNEIRFALAAAAAAEGPEVERDTECMRKRVRSSVSVTDSSSKHAATGSGCTWANADEGEGTDDKAGGELADIAAVAPGLYFMALSIEKGEKKKKSEKNARTKKTPKNSADLT
jgi:hypothetical protein